MAGYWAISFARRFVVRCAVPLSWENGNEPSAMWFWIYFAIFISASIAGTQQGFVMKRYAGIVIVETVVNALAGAGMLIYQLGEQVPLVQGWWWLVAPAITIGFVVFGILDVRFLRQNPVPGIPEEMQNQMETFGYWVAAFLLGPAAYLNWMLAYGAR